MPDAARRPTGLSLLARLTPWLTAVLAGLLALRRLDNTDTWWHLAAGRWIVEHRRVPWLDPLSYTATDHAWVNVQWLFDVALYLLHQLGGPSLLVVVSALVYGGATALMLANVRRHVGDVPTALLGLWAVLVAQERFALRPEMITYLLLQVVLWLYATGRRPDDRRLWALPPLMALWANCHSLVVVGVVVIVCRVIGTLIGAATWMPEAWRTPLDPVVRRRVVATGVAGVAATLLNPFGVRGATFPLRLMGRFDRSHLFVRAVGEFQPPFSGYLVNLTVGAYQVLFAGGCVVVVAAVALAALGRVSRSADVQGPSRAERRRAGRRGGGAATSASASVDASGMPAANMRIDLAGVAVFAGVAYLSVLARRNMALFAMAGLPCIASALAVLAAAVPATVRRAGEAAERLVAVTLVPAIVGLGVWVASNGFYRWNGDLHETGVGVLDLPSPIHASAFAKAVRLPGPIFNDVTTGGYLTWDRPVPGGVYVDGRLEVYDAAFLDDFLRRLGNVGRWQEEVDRRGVQTVMVSHWYSNTRPLVRHLLRDPRWAAVYYDEAAIIAVRQAGNDELIGRARAAFRTERERTARRLRLEPGAWQVPIRRMRGRAAYASMLEIIGKREEAARYRP